MGAWPAQQMILLPVNCKIRNNIVVKKDGVLISLPAQDKNPPLDAFTFKPNLYEGNIMFGAAIENGSGAGTQKGLRGGPDAVDKALVHKLSYLCRTWGQQIALKYGGAVTWDVPILPSGLITEPFMVQLKAIGKALTPPAPAGTPAAAQ